MAFLSASYASGKPAAATDSQHPAYRSIATGRCTLAVAPMSSETRKLRGNALLAIEYVMLNSVSRVSASGVWYRVFLEKGVDRQPPALSCSIPLLFVPSRRVSDLGWDASFAQSERDVYGDCQRVTSIRASVRQPQTLAFVQ